MRATILVGILLAAAMGAVAQEADKPVPVTEHHFRYEIGIEKLPPEADSPEYIEMSISVPHEDCKWVLSYLKLKGQFEWPLQMYRRRLKGEGDSTELEPARPPEPDQEKEAEQD